ncbi:hypothetical protein K7432_006789 [Basidiobolus ranarum]|uniref:WD40 repeat-like protein n=1 Tax=Basidiobolus ranarum TaxID=34480 RepID=A0ABR2W136_9FUNG
MDIKKRNLSEKDQIDKLIKENKSLKQKVDLLEKENSILKKSIYDLSARYTVSNHHRSNPFTSDPLESSVVESEEALRETAVKTEKHIAESLAKKTREKNTDGRIFQQKSELKGHLGAVYSVQFSPCGNFLATGSFDQTIRLWDIGVSAEVKCMKKHTLNVSDLSWSMDSNELLSGSYDKTCKIWDTESGKMTASYDCEGFVQCVEYNGQDSDVFHFGTSKKVLGTVDKRKPLPANIIRNDAMINTIYSCRDGNTIISGDSLGKLKTWDLRTGECLQVVSNENQQRPISHIATCRLGNDSDEEPQLMAINSYDNVIRVYDRGFQPLKSVPRLLHSVKGYKNKNWPIRSAFYRGKEYTNASFRRLNIHEDSYVDGYLEEPEMTRERVLDKSIILATGSSDPYVYLYNVGVQEGNATLIQRLEGHMDRVYDVAFHPFEPILCSSSADLTVKIWSSNSRSSNI